MKNITYQIEINNMGHQYVYDKKNHIPVINNRIQINLQFFNNNLEVFHNFLNSGGQEREYKIIAYEELKNGIQRNRAALI